MQSHQKIEIGIIGAGIAGLAIASEFAFLNNYHVTVFEATNRIGGRIYTYKKNNLTIELGAQTIADTDSRTLALAKSLNLNLHPKDRNYVYFEKGRWSEESKSIELARFLIQYVRTNELNDDLDNITLVDFLYQQKQFKHFQNLPELTAEILIGLYAGDINEVSAWGALQFIRQYKSANIAYTIEGGNECLATALYESIKNNITLHLSSPVIECGSYSKELYLRVVDEEIKHRFDYVVVATPLSVLKYNLIHFEYSLLSKKQTEAINAIPYNKNVITSFFNSNKSFLDRNKKNKIIKTDHNSVTFYEKSNEKGNENIFVVQVAGKKGQEFISSQHSIQSLFKEEIAKVFGNEKVKDITSPLHVVGWQTMTFQAGVYPYLKINQKHYLNNLSLPRKRLFFAGEYTSKDHPASIEGALESAEITSAAIKKKCS